MDYTEAALSYGLLLIPLAFAAVMLGQGIVKIKKKEQDGKIMVCIGVVFLVSIPLLYALIVNV